MSLDQTRRFDVNENHSQSVKEVIHIVYEALEEKDYNPINQIVGYLLTGDPAYIPRHRDARNLIKRFERDEILEELVKAYMDDTAE